MAIEKRPGYQPAAEPRDEAERLRVLRQFQILDTPSEEAFDDITRLAAQICNTPIALVSLVDDYRQWFKSRVGLDVTETPREIAFCGHSILQDDVFVVPDTFEDDRFAGNPLTVGEPHIRFYAGAPLVTPGGFKLGTLCVLDDRPGQLTEQQKVALQALARQVVALMDMRKLVDDLAVSSVTIRRSEREATESKNRFAAILDAATEVAIIATDRQRNIEVFNTGAERMLGHSADEVLGKSLASLIYTPAELAARAQALNDIFGHEIDPECAPFEFARQGTFEEREWTLLHKDRTRLTARIMVTGVRDADGVILGYLSVIRDVTEEKRAEQARRETEEWFATLSHDAPIGIFRTDGYGRCLYTNPQWQRIGGMTFEESLGDGWGRYVHPEDDTFVRTTWLEALRNSREVEMEFRFLLPDGTTPLVHAQASPVRDIDGRITGYIGTMSDITEARRTEVSLRESEQRTRAIIDNMLSAMITVDRQNRIRSANPAAQQMFGYLPEELVGKSLETLVPDRVGDKRSHLSEAAMKALNKVTEWEGQRKNGEIFPFELSMFAFPTADGVQLAGSIRDVSERHEVERAKKDFISSVSHELRTPLTSIRGSLGLLAAGVMGELPADARHLVEVGERNATRLIAIINDILDFERLASGRMEMQIESAAIEPILRRSVESIATYAEQHGIELRIEAGSDRVQADEHRVTQVVINLLSNAIKFSPRGSTVAVTARRVDDKVEVRVIDRGSGVPKWAQEKIFERFQQVDASDAKEKGGTGLGLAITRAIVEQHGGTIGLESEEGRGSTFWFRLPAAPDRTRSISG